MPLKLSTTIGKIQNIPNSKNIEIMDGEKSEGLTAPSSPPHSGDDWKYFDRSMQ
jgi:hypothetical protein